MRQGWRNGRAQAIHTDDWLITYADMITLLLCFFAIFLSVSIPKKDVQQKVHVPQPIEQPVKPSDTLMGSSSFSYPPQTIEGNQHTTSIQSNIKAFDSVPASADSVLLQSKSRDEQENDKPSPPATGSADAIPPGTADKSYAALLDIINRLKSEGPSSIEQQGDRITTLEMSSAAFFGPGSAALRPSGRVILEEVAVNIKSEQYKDYQVTVEGHTDDSPINTFLFPSNWELSTARAAAVVHFLLQQGIAAQKLRAAGYADTFPVAPNRDANGRPIRENQARNRRVVIKLEKIEKNGTNGL